MVSSEPEAMSTPVLLAPAPVYENTLPVIVHCEELPFKLTTASASVPVHSKLLPVIDVLVLPLTSIPESPAPCNKKELPVIELKSAVPPIVMPWEGVASMAILFPKIWFCWLVPKMLIPIDAAEFHNIQNTTSTIRAFFTRIQ